MVDAEAWQELGELYLNENDYNKAAFCIEELILHNPHNHLLHQRLADIRYTQGGFENLELARAYYCQAVKLNPKNLRALLGLQMVGIVDILYTFNSIKFHCRWSPTWLTPPEVLHKKRKKTISCRSGLWRKLGKSTKMKGLLILWKKDWLLSNYEIEEDKYLFVV